METSSVKVNVVKAQNGFFININDTTGWNHDHYTINGVPIKRAYKSGWYVTDNIPEAFTFKRKGQAINHRFELKPDVSDEMINALNLQKTLDKEDCLDMEKSGCHYDFIWREEYTFTQQFYQYIYDTPIEDVTVIADVNKVLEIDATIDEPKFTFKVYRTRWEHEGTKNITSGEIKTAFEYSLLYPDIVESHLPCSLTAKKSYDIIRMFIKENINPKVAHISSDYDFCLSVKKDIKLHKELYRKEEVLTPGGRSYKHKRYRDVYIKSRSVTVFEVAPKVYNSYPVVKPFTGNNYEDLRNNINTYLEKLIEEINTPLIDCPHCQGMGVIKHG